MPITMGGRCDTVPSNPVKPPQNPNPSPNPEMPGGGGAGNQGGTSGSGGDNRPGTNASGFDAMYLGSLPIAMSYTPMQQWKTTYSAENGLSRGTIFPELDLPFDGFGCVYRLLFDHCHGIHRYRNDRVPKPNA